MECGSPSAQQTRSASPLILQLTFTGVFAVQSYRSFGVPEKADRHYLFVLMAAGSAAALYGMMKFKPKKEKK